MSNYKPPHEEYQYTSTFMMWWIIVLLVSSLGGIAVLHLDGDIIISAVKWIAQL